MIIALRTALSIVIASSGVFLFLIGAVTAVLPIPLGIPMMIVGFMMIVAGAPGAIRWLRRRSRWFDTRMRWLQKRLPRWLTGPLRRTDPRNDPRNGAETEAEEDQEREPRRRHSPDPRAALARELLRRPGTR